MFFTVEVPLYLLICCCIVLLVLVSTLFAFLSLTLMALLGFLGTCKQLWYDTLCLQLENGVFHEQFDLVDEVVLARLL